GADARGRAPGGPSTPGRGGGGPAPAGRPPDAGRAAGTRGSARRAPRDARAAHSPQRTPAVRKSACVSRTVPVMTGPSPAGSTARTDTPHAFGAVVTPGGR